MSSESQALFRWIYSKTSVRSKPSSRLARYCGAAQLDDAALWGLIDALRDAGTDLIEVRREVASGDYEGVCDHAGDGPAE